MFKQKAPVDARNTRFPFPSAANGHLHREKGEHRDRQEYHRYGSAVRLRQPHGSIRCVNEIKACKRRALQRAGYDAATSLARLLSSLSPLRFAYILLQTLRGN